MRGPFAWVVVGTFVSTAALFASAADAADRIYWGGYGGTPPKMSFANLDGSGAGGDLNTSGATINEPLGVSIDAAAGRIYWANDAAPKISFANLDGSGGGDLNTAGTTTNPLAGVAVYPAAGKIYWGNYSPDAISFASLDGSGGGGNLNTSGATVSSPSGVAIDPQAGRIYWSNDSPANKISFAKLDGSGGGGDLNTSGATVSRPFGVAVDPAGGRIYWANYSPANKISFANLDGSGGGDLDTTGTTVSGPEGVAVDHAANRIYWASFNPPKISFANLDGSGGGGDLNTFGATLEGPAFPAMLKAPGGTGAPAITGGSAPGSMLACSRGSWAGDQLGAFLYRVPQSFAFQWSRGGTDIAGATASTYRASQTGTYRCRVTASNAVGSAAQASSGRVVAFAALSRFVIRPRSFVAAGSGPSARSSKRRKRGAKVSFRLDKASSVAFRVKQRRRGRRGSHGRCVKPTRSNHKARRCTRVVTLRGHFTRAGKARKNSFRFTGRLRGHRLKPGRYLLVATPTAGGKAGRARRTSFQIKRPQRG